MSEPKAEARERSTPATAGLVDALVVLVWFAVLGAAGALVWWRVTPLAAFTRTSDNAVMGSTELAKQFSTDGWYFVIALVGGLLSGVVLMLWRRRHPLLTVVLVALGGGLAAWVMLRLGLVLGPPKPSTASTMRLPVGSRIPLQLAPQAPGVGFVWPVAALLGALGALLLSPKRFTKTTADGQGGGTGNDSEASEGSIASS
ncbi:MAG: hypothetical protein M3Z50_07235 [Actinomycetota bacterium]|nr:hypothetical protein [Actinomycetota bacterium]